MLVKTPLYHAWKRGMARGLKERRLKRIFSLTGLTNPGRRLKILEIGCANGMDALQFLYDNEKYDLYGVDIIESGIKHDNFTFIKCDASELPFEDGFFDLVITIGLLEHIEPMEKLSKVAFEISRVGRAYANVMPGVSTVLEPHAISLFWPLRLHKKMVNKYSQQQLLRLNFFSAHTWSKFEGFADADVQKFWYLPPLISNVIVFRGGEI